MNKQPGLRSFVSHPSGTTKRAWIGLVMTLAGLAIWPRLSLAQPGCSPLSQGLVGWWQGNGDFTDLVAGNNGSSVGNVGFTSGEVGEGIALDGSGSGVVLGNTVALRLQNFTIEAWVQRSSSTIVSSSSSGGVIFGYGAGGYSFAMTDDGRLFLTRIAVDGVFSATSVTDTSFHHLAVTKNGTQVIFYVDGSAYPVPAYSTTFTFASAPAVGLRADQASSSFFGTIDEVALYNRALSAGELMAIYTAGSDGKCVAPTPPAIVDQPTNTMTGVGLNASFSVVAAGTSPLSYQWQSYGTNRPGATGSNLNLANVKSSDFTDYQVVVTNNYGSVTSAVATLLLQSPPIIITQPQSRTNLPGSSASFVVAISGSLPFSFQWQLSTTNLVGATNYSLVISNVQPSDAGPYLVVVQNAFGSTNSAPAVLTVLVVPTITNQPLSQIVPAGSNPSFSVAAVGHGIGPLKYQWRWVGTNLAGATSAVLALNNVQFANAGAYSVVVSDSYGSSTSSIASLTVTNPICVGIPSGLVGWWQAENSAADSVGGTSGTLTGDAGFAPGKVGGGAFRFDGAGDAVIVGNPPALQLQDFTIEAWVKRASTTVSSSSSSGGVIFGYGHGGYSLAIDNSGRPFLTQIDAAGQSAGFQIRDTNWHHLAVTKADTNLVFYLDGLMYPGPTVSSVVYQFTTPAAVGARADSLGNSFFGFLDEVDVFSRALTLGEVQSLYFGTSQGKCPFGPSFANQPTNRTAHEGASVLFAPAVAGARPMTFQWRFNGIPISGATGATLSFANVTFFQAGNYSVAVTNSTGFATSSNAILTVLPALLFANGSFETGDFTGWVLNDIASPLSALAVRSAGYNSGFGFFSTAPTEGSFCMSHGFDGEGPGRIRAAIDVVLPINPVRLTFDYRVAWDMQDFDGSTKARTFGVTVEPFGGGAPLQTNILLSAAPGTANYDTGPLLGVMDLSAYSGRGVRISFDATVPESFTGPGFFQLDNVVLSYDPSPPLVISRTGTNVLLSWPLSFSNFVAFSATNLPASIWTPIGTNLIVRGPTANSLTLPVSVGRRFFRLRSP